MKTPRKAVFLDRDGVLNVDKSYLYRPEDVEWVEGAREAVARLNREGWMVIVVTNQSGVARGYYGEEDVVRLHEWMNREIGRLGGHIEAFYYCPHLEGAPVAKYNRKCSCRKPAPGMILEAMQDYHIDPENAFLIGDSPRDVEAAERAGIPGYLFTGGSLNEFVTKCLKAGEHTEYGK
jgi:D-glycero-D-manno-heptose 1,7-bisphosphate phosphatase